jgi:hypothetical protein
MKHNGLKKKSKSSQTNSHEKPTRPTTRKSSKTKNGARAQTKHPQQSHKICQVTQGECPTVSSKTCTTNQLKSSSMAQQTVCHKQHQQIAIKEGGKL